MGLFSPPKSVLTGIDSNGKEITLYEWDFRTYAERHGAKLFMMLLAYVFLGSIYAPIITLLLVMNFNGRFKFGYLMVFAFAGFFIYEVIIGGFMLNAVSIVCDDWIVAVIVGLNFASVAICLLLLIFGPFMGSFIYAPYGDMTEGEVNVLDEEDKGILEKQLFPRYVFYFSLVLLIAMFGYMGSLRITSGDNWVNKRLNLDNVSH